MITSCTSRRHSRNVTNGIAYRRWLLCSNPGLTHLLEETIGDGFKTDASELKKLEKFVDDKDRAGCRRQKVKRENKANFANYLQKATGQVIDPDSIFDCQVKRMHEYKRQHLNALNIAAEYLYLKNNPNAEFTPKTYIFGAKAAPRLLHGQADDPHDLQAGQADRRGSAVRGKLRIVYLEDYCVSLSERLMPASEVSEQISLAGTEASGTGNMKFMLNGAITLGTLDGANVEIADAAGHENEIIFGMLTPRGQRAEGHGLPPERLYQRRQHRDGSSGLPGEGLERRELQRGHQQPAQLRPVHGHGGLQGLPPCPARPAGSCTATSRSGTT